MRRVLGKYSERGGSRKTIFLPRCCYCGATLWSPLEVGSYQGRTGLHLAHRDCRDELLAATRTKHHAPNSIFSKPPTTEIPVVGSPSSSRPGPALSQSRLR